MPALFRWGRRSLSRKRIVSVVFVLLFLIGGAITALITYRNLEQPAAANVRTTANGPAGALAALDSDGDGLKDWEEALYRTDPKSPDSDSDGTPDGREIAENRDPAKAGPNDLLDAQAVNDLIADSAAEEANNLTFSVTQQLLESGVLGAIGETGEITNADFLDKLTLPPELDPELALKRAASVSSRDLTVSPESDAAAVRRYFNAVYAVYAKRLVPLPKDDITIINEAVEREDYARLGELDAIISALGRSEAEIQKIPVPAGYEAFAVGELNHIRKTSQAIRTLRRVREDPISALTMLRARLALFNEIADARAETKAFLAARNVTFFAGEGGYQLFQ